MQDNRKDNSYWNNVVGGIILFAIFLVFFVPVCIWIARFLWGMALG
jgi:hypothetical protein